MSQVSLRKHHYEQANWKVMELLKYFKSRKTMWSACTQYANCEKSAVAAEQEKVSLHSDPKKEDNAQECSNYYYTLTNTLVK